jgi:hypothetical protein
MRGRDVAYYKERAATERRLAAASENKDVAAVHEELARQYQALVDRADLRPTLLIMVPTKHSARTGMGALHEESATTELGSGSASGKARPPQDPDQPA